MLDDKTLEQYPLLDEHYELYGREKDLNELMDTIASIRKDYKINQKSLLSRIREINSTEWKTISFTLPIIPSPTPRPRFTKDGHVYVKGAANHKKYFTKVKELLDINDVAYSTAKIVISTYFPTPKSFSGNDVMLAELGYIRPLSGGDWDNLAKTYCDMMQGVLISNDNIIVKGTLEKYYSIHPRVDIVLTYMKGFDSNFNKRKIIKSKSYKDLTDSIK